MTTRSSGFTLIELLVVVAIIGILSAVGVVSYSGYVTGAQKTAAENTLYQLALAQTEFFTDNRKYKVDDKSKCPATTATTEELETVLLGGDMPKDFNFCADKGANNDFQITATATSASGLNCVIILDSKNKLNKDNCP